MAKNGNKQVEDMWPQPAHILGLSFENTFFCTFPEAGGGLGGSAAREVLRWMIEEVFRAAWAAGPHKHDCAQRCWLLAEIKFVASSQSSLWQWHC